MTSFDSIIDFLKERGLRLVTAEACIAGLITGLLANTSGCGSVMEMCFVVYSERAKNRCLGVDLQTMKRLG